jgi:hypothetical protein
MKQALFFWMLCKCLVFILFFLGSGAFLYAAVPSAPSLAIGIVAVGMANIFSEALE